jgi:acetylornithine deacetylase/succinyl-diaminopimelate desuccinylase-like protein
VVTQRLVRIPSVGPGNAGPRSGAIDEGRIAAQAATWLEALGGKVESEDVFPGRPNTYGVWRGQTDRWIAVDVHVDTVGVETMIGDPFDGRLENARFYGRGSVGTKASLGVMLALLEEMQRRGEVLKLNLVVCASSEEETGCGGAPVFARWVRRRGLKLDQLLVAEPTTCAPIYGHKGSSNVIFEIHGEAVHSSKPHGSRVYASARCALKLAIWVRSRSNSSSPTSRFFRMGAGRWTRIWARPLRDGTRGSAARRVCSHEKAAYDGQRSDCERLRTLNAERTVCAEVGCFERLAIPIAFDTQTIRPALF